MGPIYWLIKEKKVEYLVTKVIIDAKSSINNIFNNNENVIEIRYDKINRIEYKYESEFITALLKIEYAETIYKSKNQIIIAVLEKRIPKEEINKEGIKAGDIFSNFGEDVLMILQPILTDKLIINK